MILSTRATGFITRPPKCPGTLMLLSFTVLTPFLSSCSSVSGQYSSERATNWSEIECSKVSGMIDGPFVSDEKTARQIATAVIEALPYPRDPAKNYELIAIESRKSWAVFENWIPDVEPNDDPDFMLDYAGGGGVSMQIEKCNGKISKVHFQR